MAFLDKPFPSVILTHLTPKPIIWPLMPLLTHPATWFFALIALLLLVFVLRDLWTGDAT